MNTDTRQIEKQVAEVLISYNLGTLKVCKDWSFGFVNRNYKVSTSTGDYFYRIYLAQPLTTIKHEIAVLERLKQMSYPAAYPVAQKDGSFIHKNGEENVVIYEFKKGGKPVINTQVMSLIGQAIGKLSVFPDAEEFPKKNLLCIDTCDKVIAGFKSAANPIPELFDYFEEQTQYLKPLLSQHLPVGVVHGDCFPDNTLFDSDELVAIVDFERVCYDHLLFDIGITAIGCCFVDNVLDIGLLTALIDGYYQYRELTQKEWDLLPVYIQWAAHAMIGWHLDNNLLHEHNHKQWEMVQLHAAKVKYMRKNDAQIKLDISEIMVQGAETNNHY